MQRTYAFEDQRAVRWRATLAVGRFCPLVTGGILPGRFIVLAGYAHTTSVAAWEAIFELAGFGAVGDPGEEPDRC